MKNKIVKEKAIKQKKNMRILIPLWDIF